MNFPSAKEWCALLWKHFLPQIRAGGPVYFAVDSAMLKELAAINDDAVAPADVAHAYHEACSELFEFSFRKVRLRDVALRNIPGTAYSFALLLAVQQVLVVESMLNDEDLEISEHAYFPRYRECLGIEGSVEKSNPLVGGQFQLIWDRLEEEILAAGASEKAITFFAGTGPDLNRRLPFTQALLTTHDLTVVEQRGRTLSPESEPVEILHALFRIKGHLGRRAQRLISDSDMSVRERICKQVQAFLRFHDQLSAVRVRATGERKDAGQLVAYLDREELFDDVFNFFIQGMVDQRSAVSEVAEVEKRVGNYFLPLLSKGDRYVEIGQGDELEVGDGVLLLCHESKVWTIKDRIRSCFGNDAVFAVKSGNLIGFAVLLCEGLPANGISEFFSGFLAPRQRRHLQLFGGLMADERSRVFVAGYPPKEILWDGKPLDRVEEVRFSGSTLALGDFLKCLSDVKEFASYRAVIRGEEIVFAIAARAAETNSKEYGFPLVDGNIGPVAFALDKGQPGLRGVVTSLPAEKQAELGADVLRHGVVMPFLRREARYVQISQRTQELVFQGLMDLDLPVQLLEMLLSLVRTGKVPFSPLAQKLCADGVDSPAKSLHA